MKNINLIYNHIKTVKVDICQKPIKIKLKEERFSSNSLVYLASRFKFLLNYKFMNFNIVIDFGNIEFSDKITYLIFDALLYDLFKHTNFNIQVLISINWESIHHNGLVGTAFYRSRCTYTGLINKKEFIKNYECSIYLNDIVYRRLLTNETLKTSNECPSKVCSEVATILKQYSEEEEWIDGISEVVSELVCNVSSHTDGDCLVDIDISNEVHSSNSCKNKPYLSVNIAVINFSENRLFDLIKNNLKENKYENNDLLYNRIYNAYEVHKEFFNDIYKEDHFFLVTAFQNHVSSRAFKSGMGGTGLTTLIEKIIDKTEKDYSYVLSGNNILFFRTNYLTLSNDKFIGFNKENDYFNFKPSEKVINNSKMYMPGSIYNLLLIKEC